MLNVHSYTRHGLNNCELHSYTTLMTWGPFPSSHMSLEVVYASYIFGLKEVLSIGHFVTRYSYSLVGWTRLEGPGPYSGNQTQLTVEFARLRSIRVLFIRTKFPWELIVSS